LAGRLACDHLVPLLGHVGRGGGEAAAAGGLTRYERHELPRALLWRPGKSNQGVATRTLQHWLGHKNIMHTVAYTEMSSKAFESIDNVWRRHK
jgi:hypothetical protein